MITLYFGIQVNINISLGLIGFSKIAAEREHSITEDLQNLKELLSQSEEKIKMLEHSSKIKFSEYEDKIKI